MGAARWIVVILATAALLAATPLAGADETYHARATVETDDEVVVSLGRRAELAVAVGVVVDSLRATCEQDPEHRVADAPFRARLVATDVPPWASVAPDPEIVLFERPRCGAQALPATIAIAQTKPADRDRYLQIWVRLEDVSCQGHCVIDAENATTTLRIRASTLPGGANVTLAAAMAGGTLVGAWVGVRISRRRR